MTRILKTSGFLGLVGMMLVGMRQAMLAAEGGVPGWMVGGHAHLGVLSILAVVMGFAVDAFALEGRLRSAVTGLYVIGQWCLPLTVWVAEGFDLAALHMTTFLWGLCLIAAMLIMAYEAATGGADGATGPRAAPADD